MPNDLILMLLSLRFHDSVVNMLKDRVIFTIVTSARHCMSTLCHCAHQLILPNPFQYPRANRKEIWLILGVHPWEASGEGGNPVKDWAPSERKTLADGLFTILYELPKHAAPVGVPVSFIVGRGQRPSRSVDKQVHTTPPLVGCDARLQHF